MVPPNFNNRENTTREIVYAPTQKAELNNNIVGIVAIVIGVSFTLIGLFMTFVLLFVFPLVAVFPCFVTVIGVTVAAIFGRKVLVSKSQRLQLTSQFLRFTSKTNNVELPLAQITRLMVLQGQTQRSNIQTKTYYYVYFWYVRIESAYGSYIDLEITQDGFSGSFDVPQILNDLLPRLPAAAQIDPRIRSFLQSGRIS